MWERGYDPKRIEALEDDKLYTVRRLAEDANRSETFVRLAIRSGELPAINLGVNKTQVYGRHAKEWMHSAVLKNLTPPMVDVDYEEAERILERIRIAPFTQDNGFIYFFQCGSWVKIGWTLGVQQRLEVLQCGNPLSISEIGHMRGDRADERTVHDAFKAFRHRSEWFHYKPVVRAVIQKLLTSPAGLMAGDEV